jgi:Ca2+-binding RTX toxin-like protein
MSNAVRLSARANPLGCSDVSGLDGRRSAREGIMADNVIFNGPERQLNFNSGGLDGLTGDQFIPTVAALTGGGYVVGYESEGASDEIYYQRLDANGQPVGTTLGITVNGFQGGVSVAGRADGGFVGVYENFVTVSGTDFDQILIDDFVGTNTTHVATAIDSSFGTGTTPFSFFDPDVARLGNGRFLVAYEAENNAANQFDVKFNTYDPVTGLAGTADFLTTTATVDEFDPEVAANTAGSTALVVFTEEDNTGGNNVKARLFDATTGTFGATLTVVDRPAIDADNADVAALTDGRYVVVWQEGDTLVTGRIFDPSTNSFGPTFRINGTTGDQNDPKVAALPGGGFVVTWEEGATFAGDVETNAIIARRFNAAGAPEGDAFLVNTIKANDQGNPSIATRPDGRIQIVWEDESEQNTTDDSGYGIKGQNLNMPDATGVRGETTNGTGGADVLSGFSLHETFNGLGGNDIIFAAGGNDTMNGGNGLDVMRGEAGNDAGFGGNGDDVIFGGIGNDRLDGGAGGDRLFGEAGNDRINGGTGDDRLDGGAGIDLLTGGRGRDVLVGGAGRDTFDFNFANESLRGANHDTLVFRRADGDKIDLRTIDADIDGTGGNQAFNFIRASAFSGVDGQLRFAGGVLQGDVNGDKVADIEIKVVGALLGGDLLL